MCQINNNIRNIFGLILIKFSTSIITVWGTCNIYFFSYLYHHGTHINSNTNSIILILVVIPTTIGMLLATTLTRWIGLTTLLRLCSCVFFISPLALNINFTLSFLMIFCLILPVSSFAISSIPLMKCIWFLYPQNRNSITGLAVISFSLGGIIWNLLFMYFINPNNLQANIIQNGMNLFNDSISQIVPIITKLIYLLCGMIFVIGAYLINNNINQIDCANQQNHLLLLQPQQQTIKNAIKTPQFIIIFTISLFMNFYSIYLNTNLKLIYMPIIQDDHFLVYCNILNTIVSIVGALCWAFLGDKKGFKFSFMFVTILDTIFKFYALFALNKTELIIMFCLLGLTDKSIIILLGPGLVEIFGLQLATQLLPFKGISIFLGFLIIPVLQILTSSWIHNPHSFLIIMFIFNLICLIMCTYLHQYKL